MCLALGGKQVEDVTEYEDIEYYIACDDTESFRRTFSVMVALGTAKYIVTSRWMIESFEAKEVLPAHSYLVPDSVTKAKYGFSISTTLANAKSNRPGGLLSDKYVYCSSGALGIRDAGSAGPPSSSRPSASGRALRAGTWRRCTTRGPTSGASAGRPPLPGPLRRRRRQ